LNNQAGWTLQNKGFWPRPAPSRPGCRTRSGRWFRSGHGVGHGLHGADPRAGLAKQP